MVEYGHSVAAIILTFGMLGCAVEPKNAGQCALNCSSAVIATNDPGFVIKLANTIPAFECAKGLATPTAFPGPVLVQYLVSQTLKDRAGVDWNRPVPSISFDVLANGVVSSDRTNPENVTQYNAGDVLPDGSIATTKTYYPYRYLGITTPKSNWCSDSCGVISVEIVPVCPIAGTANNVNVQVSSGPLISDVATIATTTPDTN